jgi:hypothetical protein
MRVILWISAALTAVYCGYWVVGSRAVLSGARTALAQMQADGTADYAGISLHGFPSRFDVTVDQPRLISPDGRTEWTAPFVQIMALSYRPNQIIAVWPHEQSITTSVGTITLATKDMRASATFGATAALPLDHTALVAQGGALTSDLGWIASFSEARIASRRTDTGPNAHEIGLAITGLTASDAAAGFSSAVAMNAHADATLAFSAPLDRLAGDAKPRLTDLNLSELTLTLADARLVAKGELTVSEAHVPEGRITLSITGWHTFLDTAVAAHLVAPEVAPTWAKMLDRLATLSGDATTVELPLVFKAGQMSLGPIPLGPAPSF